MKITFFVAALLCAFVPDVIFGQGAILQGGGWTPGHVPQYVGQGTGQAVVRDGGGAGGGPIGSNASELGLVARGTGTPPYSAQGTGPFGSIDCLYDAPITNPTGYHFLCLSPNSTGGNALLSYGARGAATPGALNLNINGTTYALPSTGAGSGNVTGPVSSTVGYLATWNGTLGTVLASTPASFFNAIIPTNPPYNCVGNGIANDATCMQSAITAAVAAGVPLLVGWNNTKYRLNSGVTAAGTITILGPGGGGGIYSAACSSGLLIGADGITLLTLSGAKTIVEGLCITPAGGVSITSGTAILSPAGANGSRFTGNQVNGACIGFDVTGNASITQNVGTILSQNTILPVASTSCVAIRVGALSTNANTVDLHLLDNTIYCGVGSGAAAVGMSFLDAGGPLVASNPIFGCYNGTQITPGTNQNVIWAFFTGTVVGDTSTNYDLLIDPLQTSALIAGLQFTGSWTSAGANASVRIQSTAANDPIVGVHFNGHRAYFGAATPVGVDIEAGNDIAIDASTICSPAGASASTAIKARSPATDIKIRNNIIGSCDHASGTLAVGADINLSASNFVGTITGNDFTGSTIPMSLAYSGAAATLFAMNNTGIDNLVGAGTANTTMALTLNPVIAITGTTTIQTLSGPAWANRQVTLIPQSGGTISFTTGGNLCNAATGTQFVPTFAVYQGGPACWAIR